MWNELKDACKQPEMPYDGYSFVPPPLPDTLAAFEASCGLKLPSTYREFVLLFGAGELSGLFRIAAPMDVDSRYELGRFNAELHGKDDERLLDHFGLGERTLNVIFFAATGGGVLFGWLTDEVTDAVTHEYAVYEFAESGEMRRVADTFWDFINDYVLRPTANHTWTPTLTFVPFQIRAGR